MGEHRHYYQIVNKIVKRELAACKTTKNPGLQDRGFFRSICVGSQRQKKSPTIKMRYRIDEEADASAVFFQSSALLLVEVGSRRHGQPS